MMKSSSHTPVCVTLSRGLRFVHIHIPGAEAATFGVAVRAGSADEDDDMFGLAHFVEHTIFKGTKKRSPWHIINRMEAVGGELNAYTTKEATVVYTTAPRGNAARATELVADLVINSRFKASELDKERQVVLDEIDTYLDIPYEAVYVDFEHTLFAGTPLGHDILGTKNTVEALGSDDCLNFLHTYYRTGNMVAFYCGPQGPDNIARLIERYFEALPVGNASHKDVVPDAAIPFTIQRSLPLHQAHVVMGTRTEGMDSPQRYALSLLTNITGGPGMNSLLNVSLREKRGLVYSVESNLTLFKHTGEMLVYFGCDKEDVDTCRRLVREVFDNLACGAMTSRRLDKAKKQFLGQRILEAQNRENKILAAAHNVLFRNRIEPESELTERLLAVTPEDIARTAALMTDPSTYIFQE